MAVGKYRIAGLVALAGMGMARPAFAASQGTPGTTASGIVTVPVSIRPGVRGSGLGDLTFRASFLRSVLNAGAKADAAANFCVWSNEADRGFFVTASGDGAGGAFTLTDGARARLASPS